MLSPILISFVFLFLIETDILCSAVSYRKLSTTFSFTVLLWFISFFLINWKKICRVREKRHNCGFSNKPKTPMTYQSRKMLLQYVWNLRRCLWIEQSSSELDQRITMEHFLSHLVAIKDLLKPIFSCSFPMIIFQSIIWFEFLSEDVLRFSDKPIEKIIDRYLLIHELNFFYRYMTRWLKTNFFFL